MGKKKKKTEVELDEMNIILKIPKEAVALEVTASLISKDGELQRVCKKLTVADIQDYRQAFLDNVDLGDDYDARFVLTDEGKEFLKQMMTENVEEDDLHE